ACMRNEDFEQAVHEFCSMLVRCYTPVFIRLPLALSLELSQREMKGWLKQYIVPRYKPFIDRIALEQRRGKLRKIDPELAMSSLIMALYGAGIAGEVFGDAYRKFFGIGPI